MIKGFNHNRMALFKLFISTEKKVKRHTKHFQHKFFIPVQSGILYTSNLYKVLLHPAKSTAKVFICLGFSLKEMCFVSITGEEERRKVFPTDWGTFHLPGNRGAIQTFSHLGLLLSDYISFPFFVKVPQF